MRKAITLATLTKELKKFNITPDSEEYVVGLTLLGALETGANADSVARFIHQPRRIVRVIGNRLRRNKVWQGNKTCCEWFEKDGGISFCMDCSVGMGFLEKTEVDA
jgi:hypothetical protein